MSSSPAALPRETLGERKLSTLDAIAQSLAIGPIFSGAFLTFLIVLQAGWNSLLSVILGSLGVLCLGWVVSIYARRYAGAGAIYEYLTRAVHPLVGIFAAGVYFIAQLFLGAGGVYLGIGFLVENFTNSHDVGFTVDWWVAGFIAAVLVFLMNHFGVRLTVRTQLILSAVSVLPLLYLIVAVLVQGGDDGLTLSMLDPGKTSANAIFHGILFAVTLFIGFEAAASLGEETREPKRAIPVAVLTTIALAAIFYVLLVYAVSVGFGEANIQNWGPTGVYDVAARFGGDWLSTLIELVTITDAFVLSLAFTVTAARGWFVLSRDGFLPKFLSKTSRHDTPLGGNVLTLVCAFGFLVWGGVANYSGQIQQAFGPNHFIVFQFTATTGSLGVELIYVLLGLGAFGLIVRGGLPAWGYVVAAGAVATPVLGIYGALRPFPPFPLNRAIYIWIAVIAVALVYTIVLWATRPGRVQAAAAYATSEPAPDVGFVAPAARGAPEGEPL